MGSPHTLTQSPGALRRLWNAASPPASVPEHKAQLSRTVRIVCLCAFFALTPAGMIDASSGHYANARVVLFEQLCMLLALWLNSKGHLEWAARVGSSSFLLFATLMVIFNERGFQSVSLLSFPCLLVVAVLLVSWRFYLAFAGLAILIVAALALADSRGLIGSSATGHANYESLYDAVAIMVCTATAVGLLARGMWASLSASHAANQRLTFQIQRMPLAYIAWDREFRVREWNRAAEHIFGWSAAEALGRNAFDLMVPPEAQPQVRAVWDRLLGGEDLARSINSNLSKSGRLLVCEWFNSPLLDEAGRVTGILSMALDISERQEIEASRRRTEEQFRQLWEHSMDGMRLTDAAGRILRVNPAFCQLVGKGAGELEGDFYTSIFPEPHRAARLQTYCERLRGRAIEPRLERAIELWDGRTIWADVSNTVIESPEGHSVLSFFRDVTARKQTEARLAEAIVRAESASRAKSQFLANMSHEIRTPMNGVIGMTGLLLDTPLSEEQRQFTETVRSCSESLLTLINDILDFSKIEAGKLDLEKVDFDLDVALDEVVDILAHRAIDKNLEFCCLLDPDLPLRVHGDPGRLRQILLNLAGNAIKFTASGQVVIRAGVLATAAGSATLRFSVADTGPGIPSHIAEQLFQPFVQADVETTRNYGGTGLGLAISKRLTEAMGGRIGLLSQVGQGSEFWFTIDLGIAPGLRPAPATSPFLLAGKHALIVDDIAVNRELLRVLLAKWSMTACEAPDGPHALRLLRRAAAEGAPFDIALIDKCMPDMDGFALAREIKQDARLQHTAMILLTSAHVRGDALQGMHDGFDGFLPKPIRAKLLSRILESTLARRQNSGAAPPVPFRPVVPAGDASRQRLRILLAEDNAVNQKVAVLMLEKLGHRVDYVANGREAVRAVQIAPYDVVIMDCQMPELDGFEATQAIRGREGGVRRVPIIAMTAHAMAGDRDRCLLAGMDDYVAKPVRLEELAAAIGRVQPLSPPAAFSQRG